mgnify:CR=1 FL=1
MLLAEARKYGSPPRTWGILVLLLQGAEALRFTPTHVGNTAVNDRRVNPAAVHPHARGEYLARWFTRQKGRGSPPRTWGIPVLDQNTVYSGRFTPTHVGNT